MKNNRSSKSAALGKPAVQRVCGRSIITVGAATTLTVAIQPSTFARCAAMAEVFEFYRFVSLKVELPPVAGGTGTGVGNYAIGYSNQTFDNPPANELQVIELPYATRQVPASTMFRSFKLGREELLRNSPLAWYKTIVGTPDQLFETQGNLYYAGDFALTGGIPVVVEWEVEFSQWNAASNSPMVLYEAIPGTDLFKKVRTPVQDVAIKADKLTLAHKSQ